MSGDLLDLILIVLVVAFAVAGYRQGFIIGVLSFAGFLGGARSAPRSHPRSPVSGEGTSQQALVAIIVVFVAAMIGQLLASAVGVAVRSRLTWRPATVVDSIAGAAVSVLSVLLIAWLIGSAVAYAPFPLISRQVNKSAVLRGVDRVMPSAARPCSPASAGCWPAGRTPRCSARSAPRRAVGGPRSSGPQLGRLDRLRDSIVKVKGIAPSCHAGSRAPASSSRRTAC